MAAYYDSLATSLARGPFWPRLVTQSHVYSARVTPYIHLIITKTMLSAEPSSQGKVSRYLFPRDRSLAHKHTILGACAVKRYACCYAQKRCAPGTLGEIRAKKYPGSGYFVRLSGNAKYGKSLYCLVPRKGLEPPQCCHR